MHGALLRIIGLTPLANVQCAVALYSEVFAAFQTSTLPHVLLERLFPLKLQGRTTRFRSGTLHQHRLHCYGTNKIDGIII